MAKLALICHTCQHRYRAKSMGTCPKCGSGMVGPTQAKGKLGLLILLAGAALAVAYWVFGKSPQDLVDQARDAIPPGVPGAKEPGAPPPEAEPGK
ncbi:MAG: hypothetical protein R3F62_25900 [Planctomycetota bacterium]